MTQETNQKWHKNNLKEATSPYLNQHQDNPIWWQEWSKGTIQYAKETDKVILASVGYATCHWCHVMAKEVFSDPEVAEKLNEHFVCIKVDREQRPDIDAYLMSYITALTGQGGWPLNVFLTPDLRPIYAVTYVPARSTLEKTGFLDILDKIVTYYREHPERIESFEISNTGQEQPQTRQDLLIKAYTQAYDAKHGGFGTQSKFPSFCSLLFLLYYYEVTRHASLKHMAETTLDTMMLKGLHDHLQGGFFRYCVDREWTMPHFEKMLYDQALALWTYSLAFHVFKKDAYQTVAQKIIRCLDETFQVNGLYQSAHDADTDHREGATYLWEPSEYESVLTAGEYRQFAETYQIESPNTPEGKIHLIKRTDTFLPAIEYKLLKYRKLRPQPSQDQKIITSWNCLTGIAFIQAYRYLPNQEDGLKKAEGILTSLLTSYRSAGKIFHSSCKELAQRDAVFLEDYAGLLLLLTFLNEETGRYVPEMDELEIQINTLFRKENTWIESVSDDFMEIPASQYDQPAPSAVSLLEYALTRKDLLCKGRTSNSGFKTPLAHDFHNISVLLAKGSFHLRETPHKLPWKDLTANTLQRVGKDARDCYQGVCRLV